MSKLPPCEHCNNYVPPSANQCPHCGWPGRYPNVLIAETAEEKAALNQRYRSAVKDSAARGSQSSLSNLEKNIANSKAVISRPYNDLQRLATSDHELYTTYYKLIEAEARLPKGEKWDVLRAVTDSALFPGYREVNRIKQQVLEDNYIVPLNTSPERTYAPQSILRNLFNLGPKEQEARIMAYLGPLKHQLYRY